MKVSVVIPSFNGKELLAKNLPWVLKARENKENNIAEIIVADDGSADDSAIFLKSNFPSVKVIKHKANRGFSASVNTGVRTAKGELICLLNNDVVPEEGFLKSVIPHFSDPKVFAVSLHERGYSWAKGSFKDGFIEIGPGKETGEPHVSFWVSGGSGVCRREYFIKLGGMDERLLSPFYWEDIDICYRAAKRGWLNLWEPKAFVIHKHESTISRFSKRFVERIRERNQLLVIWKNIISPTLFRKHIVGLFGRLIRHPGYARIVLMALLRIRVALKARAKEKKEAKISDEAIFARF
ncbi:MAG: glycosyltransferase family 2 protein [Patescibacteria group bacterium]